MTEREHLNNEKEATIERSSEDIRQDIAKEKENISQAVEQIGERIKNELDWRQYVKDSPYWAIGLAAGIGYLASGMFRTRDTPLERIIGSITEEVHDSLGDLRAGAAVPGLLKVALFGIATQAATAWIKNATSTTGASDGAGPRPRTGQNSTSSKRVDT